MCLLLFTIDVDEGVSVNSPLTSAQLEHCIQQYKTQVMQLDEKVQTYCTLLASSPGHSQLFNVARISACNVERLEMRATLKSCEWLGDEASTLLLEMLASWRFSTRNAFIILV